MARMYPQWLPASGKSNAERKLFHLLEQYLPNDYTVLWSIDWTAARSSSYGGGARESEVDFLLLHRVKGLLILEVKGGGVGYDGTRHEWYTIDVSNTRYPIKDPFEQAKDGKYALLRELTQQIPQEWLKQVCRRSVFGHAVVVPDILKTQLAHRPTRPEEVILDRQDLQPTILEASLDAAYRFWTRSTNQALGERAVEEIIRLYAPSWYIRPLLADVFEEELAYLNQLTEQQFLILDLLRFQKRVAISGCAGSGKTFLAIEQARRLARRGLSVLLTCYNRSLANWLRRHLTAQAQEDLALRNIDVMNFHRVAYRLCEQAHIQLPQDESRAYDEAFARGLIEASTQVEQRYDAIIADEGQDFNDSWWDALLCLHRSQKDGYFSIFSDNNQRIYHRYSVYPIPSDHYYPLTVNCRTTLTIHEEVMKYYHASLVPTCKGPQGRAIEWIPIRSSKKGQELKVLLEVVERFTQQEKVAIEDMIVLSPASKKRSRLREGTRLGNHFRLSWEMERPPVSNTLMCSTIYAFKGLERAVVILAEPDKIQGREREQLIYVALSRARFHLIILGDLSST